LAALMKSCIKTAEAASAPAKRSPGDDMFIEAAE